PRTLGMGLRIPITNCSYFGSCRLPAWTAFSVKPAIRPAYRQSSSLESRSMKLPANMGRNSDIARRNRKMWSVHLRGFIRVSDDSFRLADDSFRIGCQCATDEG